MSRANLISKNTDERTRILPKTNIMEMASLLQRCHLVIGGDTGPIHLAASLGTPVIGLYSPTDEYRNGPYGNKHITIVTDVGCRPCYKRKCNIERCMDRITIQNVVNAVERIVGNIER